MRACGILPQVKPETSRFPRKELPHMPGSSTTPGRVGARNNAPVHVAFRENEHVGTRDFQAFAALWLAYALPCRRFVVTLADANARLGANADCYSFIAVDLHHLLFAGFYRRTVFLEFRAKKSRPTDRQRGGPHSGADGWFWRSTAAGGMAAASLYVVGVCLNRIGTLRRSVAVGSKSCARILRGDVHLRSAAHFEAADCNSRICAKSAPMVGGRAIQTSSSG